MRKALFFGGFVVLTVVLAIALHQHVSLERIVAQEAQLRDAIQQSPVVAWIAGFGIYFAVSLVPGTTGKAMIAGWLFGFWQGIAMVDLALTLAALTTLLVSRYAFQETVHTRFRFTIERIDRGLECNGGFYLLVLRLMHVPYTFVNYACGPTRVSVSTFCWTTVVGLLPGTIIFVLAGLRLPTLAELLDKGPLQLLDAWLLGCLVASALLPLAVRFGLQRFRPSAVAGAVDELTPCDNSERTPFHE